jgi:hypothetical protein
MERPSGGNTGVDAGNGTEFAIGYRPLLVLAV